MVARCPASQNSLSVSQTIWSREISVPKITVNYPEEKKTGKSSWPFLYYRRIARPDELCQLKFCSSDSSSDKFSSIKTGNRGIIRLNT